MSDVDAHAKSGARRCITCHKDFAPGDPGIRPLAQFEAWGVCEECIESYQKTAAPKREG
jgi:hypothetical protein